MLDTLGILLNLKLLPYYSFSALTLAVLFSSTFALHHFLASSSSLLYFPSSQFPVPTLVVILMADASSSSSSYIHMVHRLIEECLIFNMSKEECMEALSKHANIKPVITCTVWNELEKENKDFFEAYAKGSHERATEIQKRKRIQSSLNAYKRADSTP